MREMRGRAQPRDLKLLVIALTITIRRLLSELLAEYGDPHWWPGDTPFEIAVGAILTQRASWKNVEIAISELKSRDLMSPEAMLAAGSRELESAVRASGTYRQKSRYLRSFCRHLVNNYGGQIERMRRLSVDRLRAELLELPGIGPETADSIILYALGKPCFVVDAYTFRLMRRLGISTERDYAAVQFMFERALEGDVRSLALMHALIVVHSKARCKVVPECGTCPLRRHCPSVGEQEDE